MHLHESLSGSQVLGFDRISCIHSSFPRFFFLVCVFEMQWSSSFSTPAQTAGWITSSGLSEQILVGTSFSCKLSSWLCRHLFKAFLSLSSLSCLRLLLSEPLLVYNWHLIAAVATVFFWALQQNHIACTHKQSLLISLFMLLTQTLTGQCCLPKNSVGLCGQTHVWHVRFLFYPPHFSAPLHLHSSRNKSSSITLYLLLP